MSSMPFDLSRFLPYLLNTAAEVVSAEFQPHYRARYGMLRTEWRVLFHVGRAQQMTAKDICDHAALHKTKVSRAVHALQKKGFLVRTPSDLDRRVEHLSLSRKGQAVFADLTNVASLFEDQLQSRLSRAEMDDLRRLLMKLTHPPAA